MPAIKAYNKSQRTVNFPASRVEYFPARRSAVVKNPETQKKYPSRKRVIPPRHHGASNATRCNAKRVARLTRRLTSFPFDFTIHASHRGQLDGRDILIRWPPKRLLPFRQARLPEPIPRIDTIHRGACHESSLSLSAYSTFTTGTWRTDSKFYGSFVVVPPACVSRRHWTAIQILQIGDLASRLATHPRIDITDHAKSKPLDKGATCSGFRSRIGGAGASTG